MEEESKSSTLQIVSRSTAVIDQICLPHPYFVETRQQIAVPVVKSYQNSIICIDGELVARHTQPMMIKKSSAVHPPPFCHIRVDKRTRTKTVARTISVVTAPMIELLWSSVRSIPAGASPKSPLADIVKRVTCCLSAKDSNTSGTTKE